MEESKIIRNEDYYFKTSRKVIDYVIGFLGTLILLYLSWFPLIGSFYLSPYATLALIILATAIFIALINFISRTERRYIAKGVKLALLLFILIPVLAFGACFIAFSNY